MAALGDITNTNSIGGGPWEELKSALGQKVQELKRFTHLRIEDRSKHSFEQDLLGLEASVRAVEKHVEQLKAHIRSETSTIPKVEALIEACKLQGRDLNHITSNLPQHLPSVQLLQSSLSTRTTQDGASHNQSAPTSGQAAASRQAGDDNHQAATKKKQAEAPPRWYITEAELDGVSSYMRGRLTLDKVNAAVDELATFAEANHKLILSLKTPGGRLAGPERKRATELLHAVASKDGIKGRFWFLESDLKDGLSIKLDKTGRSVLTVLRHLGRLTEQRCATDAGAVLVFALNTP